MKNDLTRRVIILGIIAGTLSLYTVMLVRSVWLLAISLFTVLAIVGLAALMFKLSRLRRVSMRTLVFIVPFMTAIVAMIVSELNKSRTQEATLAAAGVHAERSYSGIYGTLNSTLVRWLGMPFRTTFPSDIYELGFDLDCPNLAKLEHIPLHGLKCVRIFQIHSSNREVSSSTIDWLNQFPRGVQVHLFSKVMPQNSSSKLCGLRRPLENLKIDAKLTDDELTHVLAIPTKCLVLSGGTTGSPDALSVTPTRSHEVIFNQVPPALAVKIARWKQCSTMTFIEKLSMQDCRDLATLSLEELSLGEVDIDQLQVLLESRSLKRLETSIRGLSSADRQRLEATSPEHIQLRLYRRP